MPRFDQDFENYNHNGAGSLQFSGVRPEKLEELEYSIITSIMDITGSVTNFSKELLDCQKSIINNLKKHPRSENVLFRFIQFNEQVFEIHGFTLLNDIDINSYQLPVCEGMTALNEAAYNGIMANLKYGHNLASKNYKCNSYVFLITDGDNNLPGPTAEDIKNEVEEFFISEKKVSSHISLLFGINTKKYRKKLELFANEANFTKFIDAGDLTDTTIAKICGFVSKSASSQISNLGKTGSIDVNDLNY